MLSPIATASRSPQLHRYSRVYFSSVEEKKKKNKERDLISEQLSRCSHSQGFINMRGTTNRERSVVDETITRAEERVRGGEKESEILP